MKTRHVLIGFCVAVLIWGLFLGFPKFLMCVKPEWFNNDEYYGKLEIAYVAAGALFTALAFGITFFTIMLQRNDTLRKTTLDVFTHTFYKIQDDVAFIQALSYIRNEFNKDLKQLKDKETYKGKDGKIGIEELQHLSKKKPKGDVGKSFNPYMTVRFFCDKMDYIGILLKKEYIDEVLLDYFGNTIIETHNILEEQLIVSRERLGNDYFPHFTWLYDRAKKRIPKFKKECNEYMNSRK